MTWSPKGNWTFCGSNHPGRVSSQNTSNPSGTSASEPSAYKPVYEALFGSEGFEVFDEEGADIDNITFVGANEELVESTGT